MRLCPPAQFPPGPRPATMQLLALLSLALAGPALASQPQCAVDSLHDVAELCTKTFSASCETETTRNGIRIQTDESCYKVVRTVCSEATEVVNMEVCAVSYQQRKVSAEIKTVQAVFEKSCQDEQVCAPPSPAYSPAYSAAPDCSSAVRRVCYKQPTLVPVVKKVDIVLPVPEDSCVNSPVLLPRIHCEQVEERHCMAVPVVREGLQVAVSKCAVSYTGEECLQHSLELPRQACPSKMTNIKNIFEYVEESGYGYSG